MEDDRALRQALTYNLIREGYDVIPAVDGEQALGAVRAERFDLVLLDVLLPGMSGIEVLRAMRAEGRSTPVIVVSAKGDEVDRVVGLKMGADDYVAKPFSRPELLARVEAVLRRGSSKRNEAPSHVSASVVDAGTLHVDAVRRRATLDGRDLVLTPREFDLLMYLAQAPEQIFSRDQLITAVWGYDYDGDDRTVDVHVSWLRKKLRGDGGHDWFRTVRGVGYALTPPGTDAGSA